MKKFDLIHTDGLISKADELSRSVNPSKVVKKGIAKKAEDNNWLIISNFNL